MQKLTPKWQKKFVEWKNDILHLIYPNLCLTCERELTKSEAEICLGCHEELKFTTFENYAEATSVDKLFWGRCQLESTFSLLYFEKEGATQEILHQIKYKGKQKLGVEMGKLMSEKMLMNEKYHSIEAIVPVPLHKKKLHTRGYNQSEVIANGFSEESKVPLELDFLKRVVHAESQTKKGRFLRWDNIENAFEVNENFAHLKHIAILDDVITTGSTIESCVLEIRKVYPEMKISVLSLAVTK